MTTYLSLYGQFASSNYPLFILAREYGFTRATEHHSQATFPRPLYTRTGCHSGALPRTPFSALKSVYDDTSGLDPNFADSPSGSIIAHCESSRLKLRGLRTSRSSWGRGVLRMAACEGWYLGWSIGSVTLLQLVPFYTGRNGDLSRLDGVNAAMISVIGKRWQACAVRLCIRDH